MLGSLRQHEGGGMVRMWRENWVQTARGTFQVFSRGRGKPLAVTHLYSAFNQSGDLYAECFVPYREVFLVNLRGAGNSPEPVATTDLSMATAVRDLEAIRDALGFDRWDFAGHSTGGMLGLLYATKHPGPLGRLVVTGAAASRAYNDTPASIYHPDHPDFARMQLIESLKSPALEPRERAALARARTALSLHHPDRYDDYFSGPVTKSIAGDRLDYFRAVDYPAFDVRRALPAVRVPTLILVGRHDVQCPLWCSEEIHAHLPLSRLVVFQDSGHYPFLEERKRFSAALADFFGKDVGDGTDESPEN